MDFLPKDRILEFRPDTMEVLRKRFNLDKPGQMRDAINILKDWVQKQSHFRKKDFSDIYYEKCIITCKGSIEKAKTQLDRICTMRTLLPQFFIDINCKTDIGNILDVVHSVVLPKLTEDHCMVYVSKCNDLPFSASQCMDFHRANIILAEYVKFHGYIGGCIMILDYSSVNIMDYVSKINPIELRQAMTIFTEGHGISIKGIHVVTASKFVDAIVMILKQVVSNKIAERIFIHKSIDEIQKIIPKYVLPKDYGGEERSLKDLQAEWIEVLSSKEHRDYLRDMNEATTDESCRQADKFTEQYAGMPGTFRLLSVD